MALLLCGCSKIKDMSYKEIIANIGNSNGHINVYRTGYKYSLPRGLQVESYSLYNEVLSSNRIKYYLYVDIVNYYSKASYDLPSKEDSIYSEEFSYKDKDGYVRINLTENNQYWIEIMYNYAKIEVIVDENEVKEALLYSVNILKDISYNDSVIANLLGNDVLTYAEEDYNIFNTTKEDSNYLNYDNEYKGPTNETDVHDSDLIN